MFEDGLGSFSERSQFMVGNSRAIIGHADLDRIFGVRIEVNVEHNLRFIGIVVPTRVLQQLPEDCCQDQCVYSRVLYLTKGPMPKCLQTDSSTMH